MNRGRHMSYQYRTRNKKEGSNTARSRLWPDYTRLPLCLSYKESKGEEQKNKKHHSGRFPYLQGHPVPQAGYTMLFVRVVAHIHYCIAVVLGESGLLILGFFG